MQHQKDLKHRVHIKVAEIQTFHARVEVQVQV